MDCFRIDESGYTGHDLLNPDQPFQGAAAIGINDDDAARLIRTHFPSLKATELKYRALSRRPANHPRLLGLLRDVLTERRCVTYVCDKRYLLILMFLNYATEPWYYERGVNFYEGGQNYAMASALFRAGPSVLGREAFEALLAAFQEAVKVKNPASLDQLVKAARQTRWREFPEAIGPLAQYAAPECLDAIATPGVTTDAAFVVLVALITRLEAMSTAPYRVEHDQSKNLTRYHSLLGQFISHTDEASFRQSEIATLSFPLKLTAVTQVDSRSSPAVQLADVLIGAVIEATSILTGRRQSGLAPDSLLPLFADDQLIHLLPDHDLEAEVRFRRGSQGAELIEYLARNFRMSPSKA